MTHFDEMIAKAVEERAAPGLVLIAGDKTGKLDYRRSLGTTSLNSGAQNQQLMTADDSAFTWMSLSKLPTIVAILQLVEQGRLSLDMDVADALPELAAQDVLSSDGQSLVPRGNPLTLRHLLTHTSGLAHPFIPGGPLGDYFRKRAAGGGEGFDVARRGNTVRERYLFPLVAQPGEGWCYGVGIDWAGLLLERTEGESLDSHMRKMIWSPLGVGEDEMPTFFPAREDNKGGKATTTTTSDKSSRVLVAVETSARGPGGKMVGIPAKAVAASAPPAAEEAFGGEGIQGNMDAFARLLRSLTLDDGVLLRSETAALLFEPHLRGRWPRAKAALLKVLERADWMSGVMPPQGDEYDWGLGGLVVDGDSHPYRRKGCLMWSGMFNASWFIDREAGVYGVFGTQCLPPGDSKICGLTEAFQDEVYRRARL